MVIGILITLQINNLNEDRKTLKATNVHLSNLAKAVRDDSLVYANTLSNNLFRYYSSQYLLKMANEVPYDPEADGHQVNDWKSNQIWEGQIPTEENKEFICFIFYG